MINARQNIFGLIKESPDKIQIGFHKSDPAIGFGDVVDVSLFYLDLQSDIDTLNMISTVDFQIALRNICKACVEDVKDFYFLEDAWYSSDKQMGGEAEAYMSFYPGIGKFHQLKEFFRWPTSQGWEAYKKNHIKKCTFPKWKNYLTDVDIALDIAEDLCDVIRTKPVRKYK